jgi:hypothetical protein
MHRTRFVAIPVVTLIIVGLLIVGGWAVHRIGWSQGYAMGQLAVAGETAAPVPYAQPDLGYVGLFVIVGLALLLLLAVIGKVMRVWAWTMVGGPRMMAAGPSGQHWVRHWRRHHPPMPPWWWCGEETPEDAPKTAEPGRQTGNAETQS